MNPEVCLRPTASNNVSHDTDILDPAPLELAVPEKRAFPASSVLDNVITPSIRDLGDDFQVRRALPSAQRRMVGPFVFLDQMGPHTLPPERGLDVRPHPHIGLATVTYLFDGELLHRDSLGTVQRIRPGELNWMTAGRGIVHSERTPPEHRRLGSSLFGLQCWVALPSRYEEVTPSFAHFGAEDLPNEDGEGVSIRVIAGEFFGRRSPAPTLSPMCYVDVQLRPQAALQVPAIYSEQAIYVVEGRLEIGSAGTFDAGQLLILKSGTKPTVRAADSAPARFMLLGGEPMDGPRYLAWNFVSSSTERIERAKEDWHAGRFPRVPGENEFIPLPDLPAKPTQHS
jgi:redox-sensitive bicupin YhaK (pirin superfamily)